MKKLFIILAIWVIFIITTTHAAPSPTLKQALRNKLRGAKLNPDIGMIVYSEKSQKTLFSYNGNRLFSPASIQKLFIAVAAIINLGADFKFTTPLLTNGMIKEHVLDGDLVIKFNGDPTFTKTDLYHLLSQLQRLGVRKIKGSVYIDNFAYDNTLYPPGWIWDDLTYGYAAPLSALIIDRNIFIMHFDPTNGMSHRPKIESDLPKGVIHYSNQITVTSRFYKHCPLTIYSDFNNYYRLRGCLNKQWGKQRRTLALRAPSNYARALIENDLARLNITLTGKIRVKRPKGPLNVLVLHVSKPLPILIKTLLKKSDNLIADTLLKKVGENYYHKQGTWQNGLDALEHILSKVTSVNFSHNLINDGAGLSRYNLFSPSDLIKLLDYAYHNASIRKILLSSMPVGGKDGTLKGRMPHTRDARRIIAKTGSMTGVSSLAGYIFSKHLGVLSFVIIVNDFVGKDRPYKHLENRLCFYLVSYKGP